MDYRQRAAEIARAYGIPEDLFIRQIEVESGFNPRAVSPAGAGGLTQIMPATARQPGFGITPISDQDRFDPEASLRFGAQYMRALLDRYDGDQARALAAYNAGFGRVDEAGGVPGIPETQNYVNQILGGQGGQTVFASSRGMGEDRPQGLLGSLGIQRRDPSAEGETALPFYQRPTFQDTMGRLALAFNELRAEPSRTLPQQIRADMQRRQQSAQINRTAEWLDSQGMTDLANALRQNVMTAADAVSEARSRTQPRQPIEIGGRLLDPNTYEVLYEPSPEPQSGVAKAVADFNAGLINREQLDIQLQSLAPSGMSVETLPDGTVRIVQGPGAGGAEFTEGQSKDNVYAARALGAIEILDPIAGVLTDPIQRLSGLDPTGVVRGRVQSPEFQVAQQAGEEFLQAILRKDTGAAITEQEQRLYGRTYLPQPGDGPEVLAAKAAARRRAINAIMSGMSPEQLLALEGVNTSSAAPAAAGGSGGSGGTGGYSVTGSVGG